MVPGIFEIKLASTLMAGWMAATSPVPIPAEAFAMAVQSRVAAPVEVSLYDENLRVNATVVLNRDGSASEATTAEVKHLFRCRVTDREQTITQTTLAMLADLADRYEGKTIEFVSVVRKGRGESWTSPHRAGRAIDFRIRGLQLRDIRDYLWRNFASIGVGWYPSEQFIHMDTRPKDKPQDCAWTFLNGNNHYHPTWAELARRPAKIEAKPGT